MPLPIDLVFVRHGESKANVYQKKEKKDSTYVAPSSHRGLPDWRHRLTEDGRRQASAASAFFEGKLGTRFDAGFVSPFFRTRETASLLGDPEFEWFIDDRLKERDWGVFGAATAAERTEKYSATQELREKSAWYVTLDGGESLSSGVLIRVRDFLGTLHREYSDQRVIVVTHGEFMWTARFVLERMLPEKWEALDKSELHKIRNCSVLEYTRRDPDTGQLHSRLGWRRLSYLDSPSTSPDGGKWVPLGKRRTFTGAQLDASLEA